MKATTARKDRTYPINNSAFYSMPNRSISSTLSFLESLDLKRLSRVLSIKSTGTDGDLL